MILTLRTDSPVALFGLYDSPAAEQPRATLEWQADRALARDLHEQLHDFLEQNDSGWGELEGIVVFEGPGSFTGLRIGATVANALAYTLEIPVAGTSGDDWQRRGLNRLQDGHNDQVVRPKYGAEARITRPRK